METRSHRRAVLASGVRLAYAAPIVAASMAFSTGANAFLGTCDCYDPVLGYVITNRASGCAGEPVPCGYCASCSPDAGANCPPGAVANAGQIPYCTLNHEMLPPPCWPVFRYACEMGISGFA